MLEQLLIQQAALCWLKLNLVELSYSSTMKQSITLTPEFFGRRDCRLRKKDLLELVKRLRELENSREIVPHFRSILRRREDNR
jgi:hypothetical protein